MKTDTVKMYTFVVVVSGARYGGQIPASSFDDVTRLVPTATDIGELIETQPVGQICSICAGDMVIAEPLPKEIADDWAEEIE